MAQRQPSESAEPRTTPIDPSSELLNSELARLLDLSSDGIFTSDTNRQILTWNRGAARMYGFSAAAARGKTTHELLKTKFPVPLEEIEASLRQSGGWEGELTHTDQKGNQVTVFSRWILDKKTGKILESNTDITDRKMADSLRQETAERLQELADAMPQIVWRSDAKGNINYLNQRWYGFSGQSPNESDKNDWLAFVHPDDATKMKSGWEKGIKLGKEFALQFRLRHQTEGYLWQLARAVPSRKNGKLVGWYGTSTDIDEQKQIQNQLLDSNLELARFAFIASHDLKEPLRVISNYVQMILLELEGKLDSKTETYVRFIVEGVERMYALINDLLNYSRAGAIELKLEKIDTKKVVRQALDNLSVAIAESGAKVKVLDLPKVPFDSSQFLQLVQNLIANALKYRGEKNPEIVVSVEKKTDGWVFSIADNGIGIAGEFFEKIFILFQRLHGREEYSGTGIGLAVCKKIVERHGGRIWLTSEVGKGSTFLFSVHESQPV